MTHSLNKKPFIIAEIGHMNGIYCKKIIDQLKK